MTTTMAAALVALPGCSSKYAAGGDVIAERNTVVCVSTFGMRVDDQRCLPGYRGHDAGLFFRYYFDRGSRIPYYGDSVYDPRVRGGSPLPRAADYHSAPMSTGMTRSAALYRGGLGSSGRYHGGRGG